MVWLPSRRLPTGGVPEEPERGLDPHKPKRCHVRVLSTGVSRFQQERFPELSDHFSALAEGQSPPVLFVTCSDSRIDPSLITQTLPGELFVLRNAGNLVPPHEAAQHGSASAVEYAVAALGVGHIVVCGHSGCGAMGALVQGPEATATLPAVGAWLEHAAPTAEHLSGRELADPVPEAIRHNVVQQLDNLRTHPCVAAALEAGELQLHGWVYDIGTGEVSDISPAGGGTA